MTEQNDQPAQNSVEYVTIGHMRAETGNGNNPRPVLNNIERSPDETVIFHTDRLYQFSDEELEQHKDVIFATYEAELREFARAYAAAGTVTEDHITRAMEVCTQRYGQNPMWALKGMLGYMNRLRQQAAIQEEREMQPLGGGAGAGCW